MRRSIYTVICALTIGVTQLFAQSAADYSPARSTSITYNSIMSTGTSFTWRNGTDSTSNRSTLTNIGFDFWYLGQRYTRFNANVNGIIDLDTNLVDTGAPLGGYDADNGKFFYEPLTIAALYDSLAVPIGGSLSNNIKYEVTGTFPNRVLTVEWYNMARAGNNTPSLNFQIKLYEGTGAIEFDYGTMTAGTATYSYLLGIHDTSNTPPPSAAEALVQQSSNSITFSNAETDTLKTIPVSDSKITLTPPAAASPTSLAFTSVRWNKLTLNWTDNATNELHYAIYESSDGGTTYSLVDTLPSNSTSYTVYPLTRNTSYKWQVCAITDGGLAFSVNGTQGTNDGLLTGTYSVGPTGTFTNLTAAMDSIRSEGVVGPVIFELQSNYTSSGETFPIGLLDSNWTSAAKTVTIRPAAGATGLSITSSNSTGTVEFNKANYFTVDGRLGGTGSSVGLTISNTSTSGYAVEFTSMSTHDTLRYCDVQGVNTDQNAGGVVEFVGVATDQYGNTNTKGNQDNVVTYCNVHDGASTPANGINISGLSSLPDSNTTISYNNIYNYFTASNNFSNGIYVPGFVESLNVIGNSFYQTASRTASSSLTMTGINLSGSGITSPIIDSNYVGGSTTGAGGSAWTLGPTSQSVDFFGIEINSGSTICHVENNTIRDISLSTGSTDGPTFAGVMIFAADSSYVIGNTIGSDTGTSSITMTSSNNNGLQGIASWSGSNTIDNNIIGSITTSVTSGSVRSYLFGIGISTTTELATISGNKIGSTVTPNSIYQSSSSTASFEPVAGIYYSPNGFVSVTHNTIAHITSNYSGSSTVAELWGISIGDYAGCSASGTVDSNTVEDLTTASQAVSSGVNASAVGISCYAGSNFTVSGNVVDSIVNTASSAAVNVIGIYSNIFTTGTNTVGGNRVANLLASSSSTSAVISGIWIAAGKARYENNMVSVGDGLTTEYSIMGIKDTVSSGNNNSFFFNTVRVGGSGVGTTATNTYAFYRASSATDSIMDNILINNRSNVSTGGSHYAVYLSSNSGLTSNYNDLYAGGTGGQLGNYNGNNETSISNWHTATGTDNNSVSEAVTFVSSDSLRLSGSSITDANLNGTPISGITTDYFGYTRNVTAPTMGANEQSGDASLPVQATDFLATANVSSVTLSWDTQSEVNNAGFNVLREDPNTSSFKLIASYMTDDSLRGLGTTSTGRSYDFTDNHVISGNSYDYKVQSVSTNGVTKDLSTISVTVDVPKTYALYQNYPNPFNPSTIINYQLPMNSQVTLKVYDVLGREVATLVDGQQNAGVYKADFDGSKFASGVYFYRILAQGNDGQKFVSIKKLVLMK
jgi:hypothetical protein